MVCRVSHQQVGEREHNLLLVQRMLDGELLLDGGVRGGGEHAARVGRRAEPAARGAHVRLQPEALQPAARRLAVPLPDVRRLPVQYPSNILE